MILTVFSYNQHPRFQKSILRIQITMMGLPSLVESNNKKIQILIMTLEENDAKGRRPKITLMGKTLMLTLIDHVARRNKEDQKLRRVNDINKIHLNK